MTPPPVLRIAARVLSQQGTSHAVNDDRYALLDYRTAAVRDAQRGVIYAVADGVGSTGNGYRAAELTCECLAEFFTTARPASDELLLDLVENADAQVRLTSSSACTLTGIWMMRTRAVVFNLGDSAVLRFRGGELERLTPPQVRGRGLAAYVGMGKGVRHAAFLDRHTVEHGDILVCASDGLLQVVPEAELKEVFAIHADPAAVLEHAHAQIQRLGNEDDATIVIAQVGAPDVYGAAVRRFG